MTNRTIWTTGADKIARQYYEDIAKAAADKKAPYEFHGQLFIGFSLLAISESIDRLADVIKEKNASNVQ